MTGKENGEQPAQWIEQYGGGLSKRELFAAMAMQGLLQMAPQGASGRTLCKEAVLCADVLLEELAKEKKE